VPQEKRKKKKMMNKAPPVDGYSKIKISLPRKQWGGGVEKGFPRNPGRFAWGMISHLTGKRPKKERKDYELESSTSQERNSTPDNWEEEDWMKG